MGADAIETRGRVFAPCGRFDALTDDVAVSRFSVPPDRVDVR